MTAVADLAFPELGVVQDIRKSKSSPTKNKMSSGPVAYAKAFAIIVVIALVIFIIYKIFRRKNLPVGAICSSNSDCKNKACGRQTAADDTKLICCPSANTDLYAFHDYCTGMPNGSVCWSDAMCASGNCSGNVFGLYKGKCS